VKAFPTRLLIISSIVIIVCGYVYDLFFAGIPYQDPTSEMSARYALHSGIAATIYTIGFGGLIVGILGGIAKPLADKRKTREFIE
jgi:hypothetical protein